MKTVTFFLLAVLLCATNVWAGGVGNSVEVRIATDDGRTLPTYPVLMRQGVCKVYAEAKKGDLYRIEVKNRLNRRIGLVIAVDGRNIISGGKSWLRNHERMYILEPYGWGEFAGWRTDRDRINRFYFTDVPDSYAAAFGDESAMGVIAVSVYPEADRCRRPMPHSRIAPSTPEDQRGKAEGSSDRPEAFPAGPEAAGQKMKDRESLPEQALESVGTGYGRDEYSPSRRVAFRPEKKALETIYLKYEWRSTLCKLGVIECVRQSRRPPNRFWDSGGYAPPPPMSMRRIAP